MSWKKNRPSEFGINSAYHTIISVTLNFEELPTFNEEGEMLTQGSLSSIVLGCFKDKDAYDARVKPLERIIYSVPLIDAITSQRDISKTGEQAAYDFIKSIDNFWVDAEEVE